MKSIQEVDYLREIIDPLIEGSVDVQKTTDERGVLLTVTVDKSDIGRIIGKKGETAKSIRRLVRQFGMARNQHIAMKIYEPEYGANSQAAGSTSDVSESDLGL